MDEKQEKLLNTVCLLCDVCKKQKIQEVLANWNNDTFSFS
jgi:hypothetical protein